MKTGPTNTALLAVFAAAAALYCAGRALADEQPTDIIMTGKAALEDGLYSLAQRKFEAYLLAVKEPGPERYAAVELLLRALHAQRKYSESLEILKPGGSIIRRMAEDGMFDFWRALTLYRMGQLDNALRCAEIVKRRYPRSKHAGDAARLRAWCLMKQGRTDEALAAFSEHSKACAEPAEAAVALLEWAQALAELGRTADALRTLRELDGLEPRLEAVQSGKRLLGELLAREGKFEEAGAALRSVITNAAASGDIRAEGLIAMARIWESQSNLTEAANCASNAVEAAGSGAVKSRARFELGRLLIASGDVDAGVALMKGLVAAIPSTWLGEEAQLAIGLALGDAGRHEAAVQELQRYLESFTNAQGCAVAHEKMGLSLMAVGRYAEAAASFTKAAELHGAELRKIECTFRAGDAFFANGQFKSAAERYELATRLAGKAQAGAAAGADETRPFVELAARAMFQLGESLARASEFERAEAAFMGLVRAFPTNGLAVEALFRTAELQVGLGRRFALLKEWSREAAAFNRAIELFTSLVNAYPASPLVPRAISSRGTLYYNRDMMREALEDFSRVLREYRGADVYDYACYMAGMCHYALGHDKEALETWGAFEGRMTNSAWAPRAMFEIAKYCFNAGRYEDAETNFAAITQRYPTNSLAEEAMLWAGIARASRKEYLRAAELLAAFVVKYPDSALLPKARFEQAEARRQLGNYDEAILLFDEILNRHADSGMAPDAFLRKGDCQFTLGSKDPARYDEAVASYRNAANDPRARQELVMEAEYKIGRCLEKKQQTDKALDQYYSNVVMRFLRDREKGIWHGDASRMWFMRAVLSASEILESKAEWRNVVRLLERAVEAGVPASGEIEARIKKIKSEKWWLF